MAKGKKPNTTDRQAADKDGSAAWSRVQADATPLTAAQRNRHTGLAEKTGKAAKKPAPSGSPRPASPATAKSTGPAKASAKPAPKLPPKPHIEQKAKRRLGRGTISLDGRLDLHGMTAMEARAALLGFITHHVGRGHVWVLVITGKGARGEGVLRQSLSGWLAEPQLARHVVEYEAANPSHGGGGAFYLRLRKAASPQTGRSL